MKIFITGVTSSIGLDLLKKLLEVNPKIDITVLINKKELNISFVNEVKVVNGSILDFNEKYLERIDIFIHLASITPNNKNTEVDFINVNVKGVERLIRISEKMMVKRFVYLSSTVAISDFTDAYSLSKKEAEKIIIKSKINWVIIRTPEIYGINENTNKLLSVLKNKIIVFVTNNGASLYHPVFVSDLNIGILQICLNNKIINKKYLLSSKKPIKYKEFLEIIKQEFNFNYVIVNIPKFVLFIKPFISFFISRKIGARIEQKFLRNNSSFNISLAENDFNYSPQYISNWLSKLARDYNAFKV